MELKKRPYERISKEKPPFSKRIKYSDLYEASLPHNNKNTYLLKCIAILSDMYSRQASKPFSNKNYAKTDRVMYSNLLVNRGYTGSLEYVKSLMIVTEGLRSIEEINEDKIGLVYNSGFFTLDLTCGTARCITNSGANSMMTYFFPKSCVSVMCQNNLFIYVYRHDNTNFREFKPSGSVIRRLKTSDPVVVGNRYVAYGASDGCVYMSDFIEDIKEPIVFQITNASILLVSPIEGTTKILVSDTSCTLSVYDYEAQELCSSISTPHVSWAWALDECGHILAFSHHDKIAKLYTYDLELVAESKQLGTTANRVEYHKAFESIIIYGTDYSMTFMDPHTLSIKRTICKEEMQLNHYSSEQQQQQQQTTTEPIKQFSKVLSSGLVISAEYPCTLHIWKFCNNNNF